MYSMSKLKEITLLCTPVVHYLVFKQGKVEQALNLMTTGVYSLDAISHPNKYITRH